MSYIALARRWRPRTFSQLVGQEHITRALTNSLNQQRIHHAYLFTGTRGVGKTSVARLLAKTLNCEAGIHSEPCLQCDTCLTIEQGRFIDLIEIDGASRTRVEDTREILENVQYAPVHGRYKIYLIDEVHMLSQHSFNALLKTLEEPPEHVKFLLATTEPQKLPITVLSRCLQFNLKPIPDVIITDHLKLVLSTEQVTFEEQALNVLAQAARGSMRDALSLLDQVLAGCNRQLQTRDVKNLLGYTQQDYAIELIHALAEQNPLKLLSISRQIAEEGGNFSYVLQELLCYLHQLCICQTLPEDNPLIAPHADIRQLSTQFSAEDIQLFYQIALKGAEELHLAPTLAIGFEMTLLRIYAFKPAAKIAPPLKFQANETEAQVTAQNPEVKREQEIEPEAAIQPPATPIVAEPGRAMGQGASINARVNWSELLSRLELNGLALSAVENTEFIEKSGAQIVLGVAKNHLSVFTPNVVKRIEQGLTNFYQEPIKITLRQRSALQSTPAQQRETARQKQYEKALEAIQNDAFFQQLQHEFSAELVKDSIVPLQDV